ncbi:hypothetical protein CK203_105719 [Vitis vinifera]|uniref:DUF4283 domain-containing protein n=1 Tax=Vitis vinifera TaxID=29760 RepID=A0A438FKB5_VITVI|nr:hypothetical protein CK203_105719 [Vitis vinifera]
MRGGKSWFVVESKSFEILLEEVGGMKLVSGVATFGWKMVESSDWNTVQTGLADSFIAWSVEDGGSSKDGTKGSFTDAVRKAWGVRRFKDRVLSLDWWSPMVGCYQKEVHAKEDTASGQNAMGQVLVRSIGSATLGTLQIVEGLVVYAVHLWWEVPPWLSRVESKGETVDGRKGMRVKAVTRC